MLTKDWLSWVFELEDGATCDLLGPISDGGRVGEAECVILYEPDARLAMLIARELGMEKCDGSRNACRASFGGDTSG